MSTKSKTKRVAAELVDLPRPTPRFTDQQNRWNRTTGQFEVVIKDHSARYEYEAVDPQTGQVFYFDTRQGHDAWCAEHGVIPGQRS
jgi:hypothetical protein